jgi:hypothetical protein
MFHGRRLRCIQVVSYNLRLQVNRAIFNINVKRKFEPNLTPVFEQVQVISRLQY